LGVVELADEELIYGEWRWQMSVLRGLLDAVDRGELKTMHPAETSWRQLESLAAATSSTSTTRTQQ
jgi:hypothetical protein